MSMVDLAELRLQLSYRRMAAYPPGTGYGPRTLRDHEIVWVADGDATWECDGTTRAVPAGSVTLARPGSTDMWRWDPVRTTRFAYLHFSIVSGELALPPADRWPAMRRAESHDAVPALLMQIIRLGDDRPRGWERLAEHAARHMLASFVLDEPASAGPGPLPDVVARAVRPVRARWRGGVLEPVPLADMAAAASVTPNHLCRVFRATVGAGPVEALRALRLDRAAALLARTDMPVGRVANATGFANQFHFSRCFKQAYGHPPRDHRGVDGPGPPARLRALAAYVMPGAGPVHPTSP